MNYQPAGFWIRCLAAIIDALVLGIFHALVEALLMLGMYFSQQQAFNADSFNLASLGSLPANLVISCMYSGWFCSRKGATPGKLVFGIRMLNNETGEFLSFWQAVFRDTLAKLISAILFGIGFLMIAFRRDKRGLHDFMAGSCVVRAVPQSAGGA